MEYCMEPSRALKSSLRRELPSALKSPQQAFFDDFLSYNSNNGADDFSVDSFFDFSNAEFKDGNSAFINNRPQNISEEEEEEEDEEEKDSLSVSSLDRVDDDNSSNFSTFSDSLLVGELPVPLDDLAELEWVSQFVDDSSSQFPLLYPLKSENHHAWNRVEPEPQPILTKQPLCFFPAKVPVKARSKRSRAGPTGRSWSIGSSLTDSSTSLSSSSSSSSPISSSSSSTLSLVTMQTMDSFPSLNQPPLKKPKRKPTTQTGGAAQFQRRCSHCQVQKTPQWRTGPLGSKTLCNACGVRYKSGRLLPEYRPACSPTFSSDVHSNSHRKVLEMRKRKEIVGPESGLNRMVPSF